MNETATLQGLACPNCGGMVPIPEGHVIVRCPYCDMRSMVRGERGLRRYQVARLVDRGKAQSALGTFLRRSQAIASDAAKQAQLAEAFVVYLPFWVAWAHVLGWVFGQERVGSGDDARYEPREVKIAEEMTWNGAACDVGEFGVDTLPLTNQPLQAFNADSLHAEGLVFEPVGSESEARRAAEKEFQERVRKAANLDRISQVFARFARKRMGLVYYPLWVLRYLYRGRSFQVVVDGYSGQVLYGKAPGNSLYRAAMLVGGMALGAFLAVDGSAFLFYLAGQSSGDSGEGLFFGGLALIGVGLGLMGAAYRKFRYGEHYEFRGHRKKKRRTIRRKEKGIYRAREVSE